MNTHASVYAAPRLYALAFGYRDYAKESAFLREVYARHRGAPPQSFLELAAGPAGHALAMSAAGVTTTALDLSPSMVQHGTTRARELGLELRYVQGDMSAFELTAPVDLAACMLCSASYLVSDTALVSHLQSVRRALRPGGLYVLELTHPSELEGTDKTTSRWSMRDDGGELEITWSAEPGEGKVRKNRVQLEYRPRDAAPPTTIVDEAWQRVLTAQELEALTRLAGGFSIVALLGALDAGVDLEHDEAWRMVAVLQAIG